MNELPSSEYREIPIHLIDAPAHMVRMSIDQEQIRELSDDILANGLLQPLVVRPAAGRYEIIAGHRRLLATTRIGWIKVMCHVKDVPPVDVACCRASENLTRVDMTPLEEALAYKDLRDSFGLSYEEIGRRLGRTPGHIKRRMDILDMSEATRKAIHEKKITVGVAEAFRKITDPTAASYYLECAIDNGITVEVARQWSSDWEMTKAHEEAGIPKGDPIPSIFLNRKTFVACETCGGPEDLQLMKMIRICQGCMQKIVTLMSK